MALEIKDAITLKDANGSGAGWPTYINGTQQGIEVAFAGYGTKTGVEEGNDPVVFIEYFNGEPRIVVWADRTQEDPTHIIELSGAKRE